MKRQDSAERLKRLNGLLENPLLKESALAEIERIKHPKKYEMRWKGVKAARREEKAKLKNEN